jgi:hypothetical protein
LEDRFRRQRKRFPSGRSISPSAKTFFRLEDRFRRRRKRFSGWKIDFAVSENVFPSGRSVSPSAKAFFRLEDRFRRQRKRFPSGRSISHRYLPVGGVRSPKGLSPESPALDYIAVCENIWTRINGK